MQEMMLWVYQVLDNKNKRTKQSGTQRRKDAEMILDKKNISTYFASV
jgi:hypothetical protein